MKILKISGKNLASLAGEFLVDFEQEPLASSGLFAISGPTGAGKSTLLDALCLALYDATPRLLKVMGRGSLLPDVGKETVAAQDTRTLLRRGSAEGYAEVDFVGNDGAAYRARWGVRRSRTKAEGILQATTMTLHQLPSLQAIGGTKTEVKFEIERRIGLSFDQFTRAVLLAQNEFSTFLKTEDNERGELLETLTGSTIYSDISMRAFERAKKEKAALERLSDKLADQKPLDAEQRARFDAQSLDAEQALETFDAGKAVLEQQLRWHQQSEQLRQDEELAQLGVRTSALALDEASARRAALARIDRAQPARPLADAVRRIAQDIDGAQTALAAGEIAAADARLAEQTAAAAVDQAGVALRDADHARRAAAPLLDQAKALDTRIDTLLPAHDRARHAVAQADRDNDGARAALLVQTQRQAQLTAAQHASELWLTGHQQWRTLALEWPRWDQLFIQAAQAAAQADSAAHELAAARRNLHDSGNAAAAAAHSLDVATLALQALAQQKQQALAALAAFDADALQLTRQRLEQRRAALADSGQTWSELAHKQTRRAALAIQATQLETAWQAASAGAQREQARQTALAAALVQAERSLSGAEAACAASVETLRATLEDGAPCPVCGAEEHPYSGDDGALRAMLASLQAEVRRCRIEVRDNIGALATHGATQASSASQLALLTDERQALEQAIAVLAPRFHAQAQALGQHQPADGAWLADASAATQAALAALQQQEQAWRAAGATRERAQAAHDEKAAEQQRLSALAASEQQRLTQLTAQQTALEEKRAAHAAQLAALLGDLDDAFRHAEFGAEDWKDNWRAAPGVFHAARQLESKQWLAQRGAHDERANTLHTIAAEVNAATATAAAAERQALAAHAVLASGAATLGTLQTRRGELWQGQPVADVERALSGAVEQAQAGLVTRQQALRLAGEQRARLDEALLQATQRLAGLRADAITASDALEQWLRQLQLKPQHDDPAREIGEIGDSAALAALLAIAPETIRAERQALLALDQQAAKAATVLAERQAQRQRHLDAAPPELAPAPELADALAALQLRRKEAHQHATALKLTIAQDDARRHSAQAMLAEIDSQAAIERRWASLNELIGSSDGKKFRNYAQQFTLDVLLGYANAHLNQLAKRYQLERIVNPATPSLGLMVRDQDMGGEMRSVHSLSGGESFLVSLALALGLASLSSNRVRVESLFIDEGFGSLDSETLRVAMDALDGLQSMGRKVGVISHVQEMTDRIATKILVQPSAGGKSRVSVQ